MSNALVDIRYSLNIPEAVVVKLAGCPDDGSQEWHEKAWDAVQDAVQDDPARYMEYATGDEEVDVTM